MEDASAGVAADSAKMTADLKPLVAAATRLRDAGRAIEGRADAALAGGNAADVAAINAALMQAERAMLGAGLPGRPWFRHELYAPGLNTGYAAVALPRVGQAMLDRDPKALRAGIEPLREALDRAAAALEHAGSAPPTTSR
jgi:N-acetylated-alpha-linked acidic dipeptidase